MNNTKEKILNTALLLFAENGYEAVSVNMIAGKLGITKGALYKHYKNKRDIFDSIVKRMYEVDAKRSNQYDVPEEKYDTDPAGYNTVTLESIKSFTLAQFLFWTEDDFASNFRKMLSLERYRNRETAELYGNCITLGPVAYMKDIFDRMIANGIIKPQDPKQLAIEYYAPLYLMIEMSDGSYNKKQYTELLERHIENFITQYKI